jgi:hypothetical protein
MSVSTKSFIVNESLIGHLLSKVHLSDIFKTIESPQNIDEILDELNNIIDISHPTVHPDVYHNGGWLAIALRYTKGVKDGIQSRDGEFIWNEKYKIPKTIEFLERICKKCKRVRILGLTPGSKVYWHVDKDEGFDSDTLRLHLVIKTNPKATMSICQYSLFVPSGILFAADFSMPHCLKNIGEDTRWHLVFDCSIKDMSLTTLIKSLEEERLKRVKSRVLIYTIYWPYNIIFDIKRYYRIIKNKIL